MSRELYAQMPEWAEVLALVADERVRQVEKWGVQRHPDIDPNLEARYREAERMVKGRNDHKEVHCAATWDTILLEEVYESFTAESVEDRIKELTEVAAVAVAWIEDLQSREGRNAAE